MGVINAQLVTVIFLCINTCYLGRAASTRRTEHVCFGMDIRNSVSDFRQLDNCTVIEGSLKILLIDHAPPSAYEPLSFPRLIEITGYLLLYRVEGLRSLAHIFPNLAVIRGQQLFYNYALVAFEMPSLEELGLHSLTRIENGAVRLEKNSQLCYVDTVDWTSLLRRDDGTTAPLEIVSNKNVDLCLDVCPRNEDGSYACTTRTVTLVQGITRQRPLCWTANNCQIVCPDRCGSRACYLDGRTRRLQCCAAQCVGGCRGATASQCVACRGVFYNGSCHDACYGNTYKYMRRRCISEHKCRNTWSRSGYWKMHNGSCIQECPSGYMVEELDTNRCRKCSGRCPIICQGRTVDNVAAAQDLKGCTVINGILEITVGGENDVGRELEENLGMIEEVTQYVKIVNSYAILSLRFLSRLKRIKGLALHNKKYALWVIENHNLNDIWDMATHPPLVIERGKVSFHYNRKLCLSKITEFTDALGLTAQTTDHDVSPINNGDQVACDVSHFTLEVVEVKRRYVTIKWDTVKMGGDQRELLSWVINYREAPEQDIDMYNARDACGSEVWKTLDLDPAEKDIKSIATYVFGLKPFTQYGIYVQTYTIASAARGAMSSIVYFKTAPDNPNPVRDMQVVRKLADELHISWTEAARPNGSVSLYEVNWRPQRLNSEKYDQRDYCLEKPYMMMGLRGVSAVVKEVKNSSLPRPDDCCKCPKSKAAQRLEEDERLFQIQFENFLHNAVYHKRPMRSDVETSDGRRRRRRRSASRPLADSSTGWHIYNNLARDKNYSLANMTMVAALQAGPATLLNQSETSGDDDPPHGRINVTGKTSIVLTGLRHYQAYSIEVITCHTYPGQNLSALCSNRAIITARTLPLDAADVISPENVTAVNVSTTKTNRRRVRISWLEPAVPNGLVITYDILLEKVHGGNYKPETFCITHKTYLRSGGYVTNQLNPGNWSFKLRAISLAGNGSWTPVMHFYVADFGKTSAANVGLVVGLAVGVGLLIAGLLGVGIWIVAKKRFQPLLPEGMFVSSNPEYWPSGDAYIADKWEVPRDKIKRIKELGKGSFGMVYEGTAKDIIPGKPGIIKVAIKTVNESASIMERIEFLNEASIMKGCDCNHVVKLLGVVSKGQPTLVIMELMSHGDLKSFLRLRRPESAEENEKGVAPSPPPSLAEILQMCGEIADGMAYLSFKKYVHRDLAARNCMVSAEMVVKVGDFGMTRDIYETDYYRKGGKGLLPVRWMAPESLKDGIFTSQSDVWSFGVVLWEMVTLAAQPYQGLSNEEVLKYVSEGGIMKCPAGCPDRLYQLMLQCWQMHQKQRPRFTSIIDLLATDLSATFKQSSYYYNMERHRGNVGAAPPSAVATPLCGSPLEDDDVDTASAASSLLRRHSGAAGLHAPAGGALGGSPPQGSDAVSQHSTLSYNSHVPTPSPPKQPPAAAPQTHPLADRAPHGGGAPWAGGEPAGGARRNSRRAAGGAGGDGETGEEGGTSKESSGSNSSGGPPINGLSTKHIHSAYLPPMRCTDC